MKKVHMIQEILSNWRGFPNTSVAGHYEFLSQTVCADSLEKNDMLSLISSPNDVQLKRKIFGVFIHELTHWLAHSSTLWGQNFLIDIFNAFEAKKTEDIGDLWRIQKLFSDLSRINFADYYTFNGPAAKKRWNKQAWKYEIGSGLQFGSDGKIRDNYPFLFTKFFTNEGEFIKRVPLSIISLLETNAVAAEFELERVFLSELNQEEIIVEGKLIEEQYLEKIYSPELTVYSVAAHCLANLTGIIDVPVAYVLASVLSTLCLNLPSQVFPLLKVTPDIQKTLGDRAKHMIDLQDRGFAFFLLASYASGKNYSDVLNWLKSIVYSAGLPPIEELEELVLQEMDKLEEQIIKDPLMEEMVKLGANRKIMEKNYISPYTRLKELLKTGNENFQKRGIYGNHKLSFISLITEDHNYLKLPPILLGDDKVIQPGNAALEQHYQELEEWISYVWKFEDKLREFNRACFI